MTMLIKIEEEIKDLPTKELGQLREWFQNYDSENWDAQIKTDISEGKLDDLANQALEDFKNSKFKKL